MLSGYLQCQSSFVPSHLPDVLKRLDVRVEGLASQSCTFPVFAPTTLSQMHVHPRTHTMSYNYLPSMPSTLDPRAYHETAWPGAFPTPYSLYTGDPARPYPKFSGPRTGSRSGTPTSYNTSVRSRRRTASSAHASSLRSDASSSYVVCIISQGLRPLISCILRNQGDGRHHIAVRSEALDKRSGTVFIERQWGSGSGLLALFVGRSSMWTGKGLPGSSWCDWSNGIICK